MRARLDAPSAPATLVLRPTIGNKRVEDGPEPNRGNVVPISCHPARDRSRGVRLSLRPGLRQGLRMADEEEPLPRGEGLGEGPDRALWLTVAEAARQLGVTPNAIRDRIKRGTLETRREVAGNRVRTLVKVLSSAGSSPSEALEQRLLQALDERLGLALDQAVAKVLREHVADLRLERDRALAEAERLRGELEREQTARHWPGLVPWLRRMLLGEG